MHLLLNLFGDLLHTILHLILPIGGGVLLFYDFDLSILQSIKLDRRVILVDEFEIVLQTVKGDLNGESFGLTGIAVIVFSNLLVNMISGITRFRIRIEIEVIEDGYNSLIKGIDPAYPEAWGYGIVSDSFISVYNNIVYDDIFLTTLDSNGNLGGVNLFYDESSGSYMLPNSFSMVNLKSFENDSDEWWYVNSFRNVEVHKNTTGITMKVTILE